MGVYVCEYTGQHPNLQNANQVPIASYYISTTAPTAPTPQAGTKYIRVSADSGMLISNILASSTITQTSTNSWRIPANVTPELLPISTSFKILAAST